jgi:hypothetical protein
VLINNNCTGWIEYGPGRSERGLEISLLAVVDTVTEDAYAFHAQQTYAKSLNPSLTRTDYYLLHLEQARPYLPQRLKYLACLVDRRNPAKLGYVLLFSTDVTQSAEEILRFYKLRFQIEFIFCDAKQFTGLSDCQARNEKALDFHFNTSLIALNLAKREARLQHTGPQSFIFSISNVKRGMLNDHLL